MDYSSPSHHDFDLSVSIDFLPAWTAKAVCLDEDPELFFPKGNTGAALAQVEQAKAVCSRCPVIKECLDWALKTGEQHGVWGGKSEDERRSMRRKRSSGKTER
jgi:WhiB family transcriptional regulator, redox-sensing transcriptional regulator